MEGTKNGSVQLDYGEWPSLDGRCEMGMGYENWCGVGERQARTDDMVSTCSQIGGISVWLGSSKVWTGDCPHVFWYVVCSGMELCVEIDSLEVSLGWLGEVGSAGVYSDFVVLGLWKEGLV